MAFIDEMISGELVRDRHIREHGYVKITDEIVTALVANGPWLEIGAGPGALAEAIKKAGGRVVATDNYSWTGKNMQVRGNWVGQHGKVYKAEAAHAATWIRRRPSIGLLTSWPYMDSMAFDAASLLVPGQKLAYIGENRGGCTASTEFFDLMDAKFEIIDGAGVDQFYGLHDHLTIFRRLP